MPFDQIYWNHYGQGSYAERGTYEESDSHDVRFGVTKTADSHSKFSFYGKRRKMMAGYWNLLYKDPDFPYNTFNINVYGAGGFWESDIEPPLGVPGDGDEADNCDEDKGWINSENSANTCKLIREHAFDTNDPIVYSWPTADTYSDWNVDDMKKTGNGGNNIASVFNPASDEDLFQCQNRESCHNVSNTLKAKDASNIFIGIHKDYPLTLTTLNSYKGYYLVLKRSRFSYNEIKTKHHKSYGTSSADPHWQEGGFMRLCHETTQESNFQEYNRATASWETDISADPESDNIVGVRSSPRTAPLSTTRDDVTFFANPYELWQPLSSTIPEQGYNIRMIGDGPNSTKVDIEGLFRDRVPFKGLLCLPLDTLDNSLQTWYQDWQASIQTAIDEEATLNGLINDQNEAQSAALKYLAAGMTGFAYAVVGGIAFDSANTGSVGNNLRISILENQGGGALAYAVNGNNLTISIPGAANTFTRDDIIAGAPANFTNVATLSRYVNLQEYGDAPASAGANVAFTGGRDTTSSQGEVVQEPAFQVLFAAFTALQAQVGAQTTVRDNANAARNLYPNNITNANRDKLKNPDYYTKERLSWRLPKIRAGGTEFREPDPLGADHDGSIEVINAVIDPDFVPRERDETGSVYIKNITIKKNTNTVMHAKYDVHGEFIEVKSSEIYTDQSSNISATASKDSKTVTISNMYGGRTNIAHRYFSTDFEIEFVGVSGFKTKISAVSSTGNTITLTDAITSAITDAEFTLHIPRGSPDTSYTWGQYDLTEFDDDAYSTSNIKDVDSGSGEIHQRYNSTSSSMEAVPDAAYTNTGDKLKAQKHVLNDSGLITVRDLLKQTKADPAQNTLATIWNNNSFVGNNGHTGKAVRHPYFSNELSESLHIRNDFFQWVYYEYLYYGAPAGQGGHISSKVKGNVSWDKYKFINYWEYGRTSFHLATEATNEFGDSGFTNLTECEFAGFENYKDQNTGQDINTNAKQFLYGGVDKASSAIWPCYENNIPSLNDDFNQNFVTHASDWGSEYTEAYTNYTHSLTEKNGFNVSVGNTPNTYRVLDRPWFTYCAFKQNPGIRANIENSLNYTREQVLMELMLFKRSVNSASNTERISFYTHFQETLYEKMLKHKSVLAQYGFSGDMFGYLTEEAGFMNDDWMDHYFTIYESNEIIPVGTKFEVALHQVGTEFNDDTRDDLQSIIVDDNLLGDGRSNIKVDNYTLYIIAK